MFAKSVYALLIGAASVALGGCSTPCDGPGRLCAPISSITSAPLPAPAPAPAVAPPEPSEPARTFAVDSPDTSAAPLPAPPVPSMAAPENKALAPAGAPVRIGLLLPLRSESLGAAAAVLRDGFLAAYQRDRTGLQVTVIETGDASQDVLARYATAQEEQDIVVGPLARSAVTAVAGSALVRKPTIALNHPEGRGTPTESALPAAMLVVGLSIEDEARQVAAWAASEQAGANALILSAGAPWQRRIAAAFAQQWQRQGLVAETLEMSALNGYLSDAELVQLRARLASAPPALLFAAMDPGQASQLRTAIGPQLPLYGTSSLNPGVGRGNPGPELDGVRLLDLPWQIQRDHPAVMVYPQPPQNSERKMTADLERLYALGIDAFRIAREIALRPASRFTLDGVTGTLTVSYGQGPARFERSEPAAMYENGVLSPLLPPAAASATPGPR